MRRDLLSRLDGSALVILVINAPSNADAEARHRTEALWRALGGADGEPSTSAVGASSSISWPSTGRRRAGSSRAAKAWASPARSADMACALIAAGRITSPWIHMTDADAELPADYFAHVPAGPGCALYPFRHEAPPELADAMRLYELHLRYYVNRLHWAGSPYAFHTIGSTIRFMPTPTSRCAACPSAMPASFHLLNKAAKVAAPLRPEIRLKARLSMRVPSALGPGACSRMTGDDRPLELCARHRLTAWPK